MRVLVALGGNALLRMLQALQNALPGRQVICMVNQTLVSAAAPALADPSKFVGQVYDRAEGERLARENGWTVKLDGPYWRRVVPSPAPRRVVGTRLICGLVGDGIVVVCAGGGGVPVIRDGKGRLLGELRSADPYLLLRDGHLPASSSSCYPWTSSMSVHRPEGRGPRPPGGHRWSRRQPASNAFTQQMDRVEVDRSGEMLLITLTPWGNAVLNHR